jgi:pyruvate ferredoxin oxidoreductase beta subunit
VKQENKKDIIWIMMGHGVPYAATATISYVDDLVAKVKKAAAIQGFRFLHYPHAVRSGLGVPV